MLKLLAWVLLAAAGVVLFHFIGVLMTSPLDVWRFARLLLVVFLLLMSSIACFFVCGVAYYIVLRNEIIEMLTKREWITVLELREEIGEMRYERARAVGKAGSQPRSRAWYLLWHYPSPGDLHMHLFFLEEDGNVTSRERALDQELLQKRNDVPKHEFKLISLPRRRRRIVKTKESYSPGWALPLPA